MLCCFPPPLPPQALLAQVRGLSPSTLTCGPPVRHTHTHVTSQSQSQSQSAPLQCGLPGQPPPSLLCPPGQPPETPFITPSLGPHAAFPLPLPLCTASQRWPPASCPRGRTIVLLCPGHGRRQRCAAACRGQGRALAPLLPPPSSADPLSACPSPPAHPGYTDPCVRPRPSDLSSGSLLDALVVSCNTTGTCSAARLCKPLTHCAAPAREPSASSMQPCCAPTPASPAAITPLRASSSC